MKRIVSLLAMANILLFIIIGCGDDHKHTAIDSPNKASDGSENYQNRSTVQQCGVCKGTGVILWYDGSLQSCPSCGGSGVINVSQLAADIQYRINSGGRNSYESTSRSRNREQIANEIYKLSAMINDYRATLARLQSNNESITLWPTYENMIRSTEEKLFDLKNEYNSVSE